MAGSRQLTTARREKPTVEEAKAALREAAAHRGPSPLRLCPVSCNPWVLVGSAAVAGVIIGVTPGALPALLRTAGSVGTALLSESARR